MDTPEQPIGLSSCQSVPSAPPAQGRRYARAAVVTVLVLVAVLTARSYLVPVAWATVIAVTIWPIYHPFAERMSAKGKWVAPLLATISVALVLSLPVFLTLTEVGRQGELITSWIAQTQQGGVEVPDWIKRLPLLGPRLSGPQGLRDLFSGINVENLTRWTRSFGGEIANRLFIALLTFIALFSLLRDGAEISDRLFVFVDGWLGQPSEQLLNKIITAVRGVVNGTVIVAIAEGMLIGIGYWVAGAPHAVFLLFLTMAFAMLPLGAWFAFSAAALVLLLNGGSLLAAVAVFGWGVIVMLIGDNFVQPALIGGSARLPFLWTLIGVLGGLETFGLLGLFLGPVIMAAVQAICHEWIDVRRQHP